MEDSLPEPTNDDRVAWAAAALAAFNDTRGADRDAPEENIGDLVTDLLHLAAREGADVGRLLRCARRDYKAERRPTANTRYLITDYFGETTPAGLSYPPVGLMIAITANEHTALQDQQRTIVSLSALHPAVVELHLVSIPPLSATIALTGADESDPARRLGEVLVYCGRRGIGAIGHYMITGIKPTWIVAAGRPQLNLSLTPDGFAWAEPGDGRVVTTRVPWTALAEYPANV